MRTISTCTAAVAAALALLGPVAPAGAGDVAAVEGTSGSDRLAGSGGDDLILGRPGNDVIRPQAGSDRVRAGFGDDRIFLTADGAVDRIHCGPGLDTVYYHYVVDMHDIIDTNCESMVA